MSERLRDGVRAIGRRAGRLGGPGAQQSPTPSRPATRLHVGPAVPALAVRAACALLVVAATALVAVSGVQLLLGALLAAGMLLRPSMALTGFTLALLGAMLLLLPTGGWRIFPLVLASHALWQLTTVCVAVGWRGRVSVAVLRAEVRGFLVVQAVAQAAAVASGVLHGGLELPWLAVAAVLSLGLLTWLLPGRLRG